VKNILGKKMQKAVIWAFEHLIYLWTKIYKNLAKMFVLRG